MEDPSPEACLSVVIPCYDEVATIKAVVEHVLASPHTGELVIVDDGSTDGTRDVLSTLDDPRVVVVLQPENRGKGAALREPVRYPAARAEPYSLLLALVRRTGVPAGSRLPSG